MKIFCLSDQFRKCADNKTLRISLLFRTFGKEGDGFVLMYKRIENGRLKWPRKREDACSITPEELHRLLDGLTILEEPSVRKAQCTEIS